MAGPLLCIIDTFVEEVAAAAALRPLSAGARLGGSVFTDLLPAGVEVERLLVPSRALVLDLVVEVLHACYLWM